jgi:histidine ammonia-lyase
MGTLAARDALRVVELTETVAAIVLLAAAQGTELRGAPPPRLAARLARLRAEVPALATDRRQDHDIARVLTLHRQGALYEGDVPFVESAHDER